MSEERSQHTAKWLTADEAASYLQITRRTLDRYRVDGFVTAYRFGRRSVRFRIEDLDAMGRQMPAGKLDGKEEPTGIGAVVEDSSQVEHVHLGSGLWVYGTTDGPSEGHRYEDIDVVRVLSEGVNR